MRTALFYPAEPRRHNIEDKFHGGNEVHGIWRRRVVKPRVARDAANRLLMVHRSLEVLQFILGAAFQFVDDCVVAAKMVGDDLIGSVEVGPFVRARNPEGPTTIRHGLAEIMVHGALRNVWVKEISGALENTVDFGEPVYPRHLDCHNRRRRRDTAATEVQINNCNADSGLKFGASNSDCGLYAGQFFIRPLPNVVDRCVISDSGVDQEYS